MINLFTSMSFDRVTNKFLRLWGPQGTWGNETHFPQTEKTKQL